MSGKQAKRERQAQQFRESLAGPDTFTPAPPLCSIPMEAWAEGMTEEAAWRDISPWLWFERVVPADEYISRGVAPPVALYVSQDYQVAVHNSTEAVLLNWPGMWHLSIKRRDKGPIDENHWRVLQQIKNTLVGTEHEAVELFPAESRLVDTALQYHIWCLKEPWQRFPFGFMNRLVHGEPQLPGVQQRPFDPSMKPF